MKFESPQACWLAICKPVSTALLLILAGCGPLISFGDDGPADKVYGLEYDSAPAATGAMSTIVYVEEPLMSDGLGGNHISVVLDNNERTSLMGVRWSANTTDLIRDFLVRGVAGTSGVRLLGEGAIDVQAGCRLGLKIWSFEFVPGDSIRDDRVDVEIEFILVRYSDNRLIGQPTFSSSQGVEATSGAAIVAAFHQSMISVSTQAGSWLATQSGECSL